MKYQLIGENNYNLDPIGTILKNRKTDRTIFELDESVTHSHNLLNNIQEGIDCLIKHNQLESETFIQIDGDTDGITSSTILIQYLKKVFPKLKVRWALHDGKEHGVIIDKINKETKLLILPDSGSNQYEEHKKLKSMGIDVLVIDHHECESESKDAIVINNQLSPEYPNKNFSGAGIVYKFCKAIDERFKLDYADEYLDLVSIGNIGDMMDLREPETRYYVKQGLLKIKNPFINNLILKQDYSMKGVVNITNISFYITPLINAAVRASSMEEKIDMMKSFLGSNEEVYYKKNDVYETIQTATARKLGNTRSRQNRLRDKGVEQIELQISDKKLYENKILIIDVTSILDKNLTGLVANQIAKKYKRPVLLLREKKAGIYGGSARGYENGYVKDFKTFLLNTDKFILCEGHKNAFGVEIKKENLDGLNTTLNDLLIDYSINEDIHMVDFIVPEEDVISDLVLEIGGYCDEWGSTVEEPQLIFHRVEIPHESISIVGKKSKTYKIKYNDLEFVKFYYKDEFAEVINDGVSYIVDILGKCKINHWDNKKIPQIEILDLKLIDTLYF